jgi:hypothetical protein
MTPIHVLALVLSLIAPVGYTPDVAPPEAPRVQSPQASQEAAVAPEPSQVAYVLSREDVLDLVDSYGGPPEMVAVAYCESRFQAAAVNATSGARGPWQFMPGTWAHVRAALPEIGPYSNAHDWDKSTRAAVWLWLNAGPQHWSCAR